jgi:hypothetical protein
MWSYGRILTLVVLLLSPTMAHAQFDSAGDPPRGGRSEQQFGVAAPLPPAAPPQAPGTTSVQVDFWKPIPVTGRGNAEDQNEQAKNARLQMYEDAKKECASLSKSFHADCKLVTLHVRVINPIGVVAIHVMGTATYELSSYESSAH